MTVENLSDTERMIETVGETWLRYRWDTLGTDRENFDMCSEIGITSKENSKVELHNDFPTRRLINDTSLKCCVSLIHGTVLQCIIRTQIFFNTTNRWCMLTPSVTTWFTHQPHCTKKSLSHYCAMNSVAPYYAWFEHLLWDQWDVSKCPEGMA